MNDKKIFVGKKPADKELVIDPNSMGFNKPCAGWDISFEHYMGTVFLSGLEPDNLSVDLNDWFSATKINHITLLYNAVAPLPRRASDSLGPTFEHFLWNTVYNVIVNNPEIPLRTAFPVEKIAWLRGVYYAAPLRDDSKWMLDLMDVYTPDKTLEQPVGTVGVCFGPYTYTQPESTTERLTRNIPERGYTE